MILKAYLKYFCDNKQITVESAQPKYIVVL